MHISCPKCDKTINAKDYNLFQIWECPDCEWRFRGVHAGQPVFLNYIFEFISPLYHGKHINDRAECPLCGAVIDLRWIFSETPGRNFGSFKKKGYNGPYVCHACRNPLPWDYPLQKKHVAESHNKWVDEHNKQVILERKEAISRSKPHKHTEEEKNHLSRLAAKLYKEKK